MVVAVALASPLASPALGEDAQASAKTSPGREPKGGLLLWREAPKKTLARPLVLCLARLARQDAPWRLLPIQGTVSVRAVPGEVELNSDSNEDGLGCRPLLYVPPPGFVGTGHLELQLGSNSLQAAFEFVAPPEEALELHLDPATLVKGEGASAKIVVKSRSGRRPQVVSNLGTVGPLLPRPEGGYEAIFRPGPARYPEVAVITAFLPWPGVGSPAVAFKQQTLPLSAAIILPGKTRPRVQMSVEIAGTSFGPVPSDSRGVFRIPVVVPPGHGVAKGVSVDRLGNRRRTPIQLHLPPTNRLAVAAYPQTLIADGQARAAVVVSVIDRFGRFGAPSGGKTPQLSASRGALSALRAISPGVWQAWYRAPKGVGSAALKLRLPGSPRSAASLTLTLVAGAPTAASITLTPPVTAAPSSEPVRVEIKANDRFGSPVVDARLKVTCSRGRLTKIGPMRLSYAPPQDPSGWEDSIRVALRRPLGSEPARLVFDAVGGRLLLLDALGRPVPHFEISVNGSKRKTDDEGSLALPKGRQAVGQWIGREEPSLVSWARDSSGGWSGFPLAHSVLTTEASVVLMEPMPVLLKASATSLGVTEDGGAGRALLRWELQGVVAKEEPSLRLQLGERDPQWLQGRRGSVQIEAHSGDRYVITEPVSGSMFVGVVQAKAADRAAASP